MESRMNRLTDMDEGGGRVGRNRGHGEDGEDRTVDASSPRRCVAMCSFENAVPLACLSPTGSQSTAVLEILATKFALPLLVGFAAILPAYAGDGVSGIRDAQTAPEVVVRPSNDEKRPKTKFLGARNHAGPVGAYIDECLNKIVSTGNLTYPAEAKNRLFGIALMSLEILPGGEIRNPHIEQSSGHPLLDDALKRAAEQASPCPTALQDLIGQPDILEVAGNFAFTRIGITAMSAADDSSLAVASSGVSAFRFLPDPLPCDGSGGRLSSNPPPIYPHGSRLKGEQGTTIVRARIGPKGAPDMVEIINSSGFEHLDQAAVEAVKTWCFAPSQMINGAGYGWLRIPIVFRLSTAQSTADSEAARAAWVRAIVERITSNVVIPPDSPAHGAAVFRISQIPDGTVIRVELTSSSGYPPLDHAFERAIMRTSPLPVPAYPDVFERDLELRFAPTCLAPGQECGQAGATASTRLTWPDAQIQPKATTLWAEAVRKQIRSNTFVPRDTPAGAKAVLTIVQHPDGTVDKVEVKSSSGFEPFDRAAEQAILASSPFPAVRHDLFKPDLELTFACEAPTPGTPESLTQCSLRDLDVR